MRECDLLIVGGGLIGLSCAWHHARRAPGQRIVVVDRPTTAANASRAAAGMLAPFGEFGEVTPLSELCRRGLDSWRGFLADLCEAAPAAKIDYRPHGTILPAIDDDGRARLASRRRVLEAAGAAHDNLTGDEARSRCPALSAGVVEAIFVRDEALVNPRDVHAALRDAAVAAGVELLPAEIEGIDWGAAPNDGAVVAMTIDGGRERIAARRVLIATGAWTKEVAELTGVAIPVRPVKGQIGRVEAPAGLLGPVVHAHEIYVAERTGGGIIFGATMEEADFDLTVQDETLRAMQAAAAQLVPAIAELPVVESWAGLRPCPLHGAPIFGRPDPARLPALWVATGHFRNGVLLTPLTGELLAASLSAAEAGDDAAIEAAIPAPFRAARLLASGAAATG